MILASIILHNQMVDHRVERDEVEDPGFYNVDPNVGNPLVADHIQDMVEQHDAGQFTNLSPVFLQRMEDIKKVFSDTVQVVVEARWAHLHDKKEHMRLKRCIMLELCGPEDSNDSNRNRAQRRR